MISLLKTTSPFLLHPSRILSLPTTYLCSAHPWLSVVFWKAQPVLLCGFVYAGPSPWCPTFLYCLLENPILSSGLGSNAILSLWPKMTPLPPPFPESQFWPQSHTLDTCFLTLYPILTLFLHFYWTLCRMRAGVITYSSLYVQHVPWRLLEEQFVLD